MTILETIEDSIVKELEKNEDYKIPTQIYLSSSAFVKLQDELGDKSDFIFVEVMGKKIECKLIPMRATVTQ